MSEGFFATHTVPKGGTRAWDSPDPASTPIATLHQQTELELLDTQGGWARVRAENGWEGWVDERVLVPVEVAPAPEAEAQGWHPTHAAPATGTSAWASPDGSAEPTATLAPGTRLEVVEEQGAWARVAGENGWTGWVDARTLRALGAAASNPAGVLPFIGAAVILIGSFLPLLSWGGADINAWQIPLLSLFANSAAASWLPTGVFLLATLSVAIPLATGRSLSSRVLIGIGAIGVDVAFITLLRTGAEDLSSPGVGLFVILAGGLTVMAESLHRRMERAKG